MKIVILLLGVLWLGVSAAFAQVEAKYPDVPLDDPAYADINLLSKPGIIECGGASALRAMTRFEFAVAVARLWENMDANPILKKSVEQDAVRLAAFKRLAKEFQFELNALGLEGEKMDAFDFSPRQSRVQLSRVPKAPRLQQSRGPAVPPFQDVPKSHWAYEAVEKLRQSDIVVGFPAEDSTRFNHPAASTSPAPRGASGRGNVRR